MAERFGTPGWAQALEGAINASGEYRDAGERWGVGFNGNVLLAFEPDGLFPRGISLLVRLEAGACTGAEFVDGPGHAEAGFTLRAPFTLWREILERKTAAAAAVLTGRVKVEGDKRILLEHIAAHRALLHCAASVDTEF